MTGLDALLARGWKFHRPQRQTHAYTGYLAALDAPTGVPWVSLEHDDPVVAKRMLVAAALVAEGHDLIGLLRDARDLLEVRDEADRIARGRIDAVLAAEAAEALDAAEREAGR